MESPNNPLFQINGYKNYSSFKPEWELFSDEQKKYSIAFSCDANKKTAIIQCLKGDNSEYYLCSFDKDQTIVPGIKRFVISVPNGDIVGTITYCGLDYSIINEHIAVQIDGLHINYLDSSVDDDKLLASCYMYDDKDTIELCCTRASANCFTVDYMKALAPKDLLMTLIYPIIGFI